MQVKMGAFTPVVQKKKKKKDVLAAWPKISCLYLLFLFFVFGSQRCELCVMSKLIIIGESWEGKS